MRTLRILPAAIVFAFAWPVLASEDPPKLASPDDVNFVKEASFGNMTEVALGRLAVEKSSDPQVKKFGQQMIDDHTKAQAALRSAATKEGLSRDLPGALDHEHEQVVEKFRNLSGPEFDRAYKEDMLKDHQEDVAAFQKEAALGSTPLEKHAADTLPTLQHHLKMAQEMNATK
jgi:putative membrane protein